MAKHLLIAGCGYLGEKLLSTALSAGHRVTALTLSEEHTEQLRQDYQIDSYACDLSDAQQIQKLAAQLEDDNKPDWIVHCASSNRGGEEAYQRVFVEGSAHLIKTFPDAQPLFTSSTSVYPQKNGSSVNEESAAEPERETGKLLRRAEDQVLAAGGIVTRLSGIYGPGRSYLLKNFLEGKAQIDLLPSTEKNELAQSPEIVTEIKGRNLNQIHVADAAQIILQLLAAQRHGIYNLSNGETLSQRDCYVALSRRFKQEVPPIASVRAGGKRDWSDKFISIKKLLQDGYKLSYPNYLASLNKDPSIVSSIAEAETVVEQPSILIIEDEEGVRQLLEVLLSHHGYRTFSAENGQEGIDLLTAHADEIDLVICDMKMPGLTGEETFLQIRRAHPEIPVLMCSGVDVNLNAFSESPELQPNGCLTKPFTSEILQQTVSGTLQSKAA